MTIATEIMVMLSTRGCTLSPECHVQYARMPCTVSPEQGVQFTPEYVPRIDQNQSGDDW